MCCELVCFCVLLFSKAKTVIIGMMMVIKKALIFKDHNNRLIPSKYRLV